MSRLQFAMPAGGGRSLVVFMLLVAVSFSSIPRAAAKLKGVSYSPYSAVGEYCRDNVTVAADLEKLRLIADNLRLAALEPCLDRKKEVFAFAKANGMKILIGVQAAAAEFVSDMDKLKGLLDDGYASTIRAVNVGNEAVLGGFSVSELASRLNSAKAILAPYNIPVTYIDIPEVWLRDEMKSQIGPIVDIVSSNIHPFFMGLEIGIAANVTLNRLDDLKKAIPGKPALITETGWPTEKEACCNYDPNYLYKAQSSISNAAIMLKNFTDLAAKRGVNEYFYFEAFDADYKRTFNACNAGFCSILSGCVNNTCEFEYNWGLMNADGSPKAGIDLTVYQGAAAIATAALWHFMFAGMAAFVLAALQ